MISEWFHTRSKNNIADLGTRNEATVKSISEDSEWQLGKKWMYLPVDQWPVTQEIQNSHNVEEDVVEISAAATVAEPVIFDFEALRGQTYDFVIKLVAIVIKMARSKSSRHPELTVDDLVEAENYIIKQCMTQTKELLKKGHLKSLRAEEGADGIIRLGSRA